MKDIIFNVNVRAGGGGDKQHNFSWTLLSLFKLCKIKKKLCQNCKEIQMGGW